MSLEVNCSSNFKILQGGWKLHATSVCAKDTDWSLTIKIKNILVFCLKIWAMANFYSFLYILWIGRHSCLSLSLQTDSILVCRIQSCWALQHFLTYFNISGGHKDSLCSMYRVRKLGTRFSGQHRSKVNNLNQGSLGSTGVKFKTWSKDLWAAQE